MTLREFLHYSFFGNSIEQYLTGAAIFIVSLLLIGMTKYVVVARMKKLTKKTETGVDDVLVSGIDKNMIPLLLVGALYVSVQGLHLNASLQRIFHIGVSMLLIFFSVRFLLSIVTYGLDRQWKRTGSGNTQRQSFKLIQTGVQSVIWIIALIVLLDNLGIKISTLVAGLGIGGIAVALASQAVLGDLFSYFMILIDRPFEIGDFIIIDEFMGTIEHVGIKSTRIRSLGGELLVFRNTDLTGARIRNYKKMEERRVVFSLGVTYGTSLEKQKKIPAIVSSIVASVPKTRFDRAHFKEYGEFSLIYEVVYYVLSADYNLYMDIQQEINFKIREGFDTIGVEFAFPTSTVFLKKDLAI